VLLQLFGDVVAARARVLLGRAILSPLPPAGEVAPQARVRGERDSAKKKPSLTPALSRKRERENGKRLAALPLAKREGESALSRAMGPLATGGA
jgi:hypothetical protein